MEETPSLTLLLPQVVVVVLGKLSHKKEPTAVLVEVAFKLTR
jgi:hypothetical protein